MAQKVFRSLGEQLQSAHRSVTGLSSLTMVDGGALISPEFSEQLIMRMYDGAPFLGRCTHFQTTKAGSDGLRINTIDEVSRANGNRMGGLRCYWHRQGDLITKSKPKLTRLDLQLDKLIGLVYVTDELMQDVPTLQATVEMAFGEEFSFTAEQSALFGNGIGEFLGLMHSSSLITVSKESGQAAGTITGNNIVEMYSRMWGTSRHRGIWLCNPEAEKQIIKASLTTTNVAGTENVSGFPLYQPTTDPDKQPYPLVLGRPLIPHEACQKVGTTGDLLFVDPSQYLILEKGQLTTTPSIHLQFLYDESALKFTWRVAGQPLWAAPVTPPNGNTTLSPFIALETRS